MKYKAVVIGTSFGGLEALKIILPSIPKGFSMPVVVVLHIGDHNNETFLEYMDTICHLRVKEAESHEPIIAGTIYFAPPNYHLLVENDQLFSLSTDEKHNFSRPSIDILFESAAWVYGKSLIGVVLTGANADGAQGLKTIQEFGGVAIVQNPCSAVSPAMPRAAIKIANPQFRLNLDEIGLKLMELSVLKH